MSKIIRRTITVTITETWTIAWPDCSWPGIITSDTPRGTVLTNTQVSRKISVVTTSTDQISQLVDTANQNQRVNKHISSQIDYEPHSIE